MKSRVPESRIRPESECPPDPSGDYVLYWMTSNRRSRWNFALQRAVEWARELQKPLVIFEGVRCDYPWASDRFHRFLLDGMAENARRFSRRPVSYYPRIETRPGEDSGLLNALAGKASVVVADFYPGFFHPHMLEAASKQVAVRMESVDSNGILSLHEIERVFPTAYAFRRHVQRQLRRSLKQFPLADPLARVDLPTLDSLPPKVTKRWPAATAERLDPRSATLGSLPIDHSVAALETKGGSAAADALLKRFLEQSLGDYAEQRNQPEATVTSQLSPYLHFGHISSHQGVHSLLKREEWSPERLSTKPNGARQGYWGASESAEAFLDQWITWRELGYNMSHRRSDYDRYESLPSWALQTLADHEDDPRPHVYTHDEFENAVTHDPIWNAAQNELVRTGKIHNYLRMLWGKKILEWSPSPREALATMIDLNNRYALDGRDPNSYSGIFWVLGRYDRAWGPERPIFGKVRYMSSQNTARKVRLRGYLEKYGTRLQEA